MTEEYLRMILMGTGVVLLVVVVYAVIELARTLRWIRYTAEDLQPSIKQATEVREALEPTVKKANEILETLEPSMQRIDPLMERISLTVDAVNLEIMRADQILANLTDVTDVASNAAKAVNNITDTPLNLLTSATDKVRTIFSDRKPERDTLAALNEAGINGSASTQNSGYESVSNSGPAQTAVPGTGFQAATAGVSQPGATNGFGTVGSITAQVTQTVDASAEAAAAAAASAAAQVAALAAEEVVPPYQDEIEVVEPEGTDRPQWPF
jgi:hypothetical protein